VTVAVKNSLGMNLGLVPPGAITMGSPDQEARRLPEETPHRVVLTRSVRLAACEVTQGQWEALMDDNPANAFGIHDMHGNMSEWCADGYAADTYAKAPLEDPPGSVDAEACVIRGGAWRFSCDDCRSAVRHGYDPRIRAYDVGFRVAVDLPGDVGPGTNARSSVGSNAGTEPSPEEP
jgi:formylglycine-generating enzyme required for sulfatase activity